MLGGGAGGGAVGQFPLEQWFYEMPVCTRWWTTATVAISFLVQCHIITPFQLFYSFRAVFIKSQVWLHYPLVVNSSGSREILTTVYNTVLAPRYHVPIFRPSLPRPPLPRLLPPTLLTPSRRIIRPLTSAFLMASPLCNQYLTCSLTITLHALPRLRAE